ncbi:unnamed protein product [Closterium sp. NIES-64]|nr:unnamed protein product [Closterium sp. NIES-64]
MKDGLARKGTFRSDYGYRASSGMAAAASNGNRPIHCSLSSSPLPPPSPLHPPPSASPSISSLPLLLPPFTPLPHPPFPRCQPPRASPDMAAARAEALLPRERSECNLQGGHEQHLHHHHHGFGDKTITFWGSCVLNFNNITGPAVVVLPLLYAQAGWFLPTAGLTLMWLFSSFAATMMCEAQQRIPGNKGFARRFEYCTLVRHYFGDRWYALAQIGFNAGLLASNIASMIVTSQVLDSVVYRLAGTSYGMDYGQWPPAFIESLATGGAGGNVCAWGTTSSGDCNRSVISLGFVLAMAVCIPFARLNLDDNMGFQFVLAMAVCIPFARLNLDDNMGFQWLSMLAQLLFSFEFAAQFLSNLLPGSPNYCAGNGPGRTPFLGLDISQVLGVCVFAYSYVSTIPSWANEKKPGVNVNRAIWLPASVGCALNILLGLLGAWAYKLVDDAGHPFKGTDNMLNMLDGQADAATACGHPHVAPATEFSVYMWGFFGYIPGIPILAIMVRYNLQASGLFSDSAAFFWAVVAPWLLTAFFYQAQASGLFSDSAAFFWAVVAPWLLTAFFYQAQASGLFSESAALFWAVVAPALVTHCLLLPSSGLGSLIRLCTNPDEAPTNPPLPTIPPLHALPLHPSAPLRTSLEFCNWVAIICQGFINLVVPTLLFRAALITYPTPEELESRGYLLVSSSPPSSTPLTTTPPASTPLRSSSSADRSLVGLIQNVIAALSPKHSPSSSEGGAGVMESDMEGAGAYKQMPDGAGGEVGRGGDVIVEGARVVVDSESDSGSVSDEGGSETEPLTAAAAAAAAAATATATPATTTTAANTTTATANAAAPAVAVEVDRNRGTAGTTTQRQAASRTTGADPVALIGPGQKVVLEPPVQAVPTWLRVDPLVFASAMTWTTGLLVAVSIAITLLSP